MGEKRLKLYLLVILVRLLHSDIFDYPFIKTWHLASIALYVCTQIETISFM